MTDLLIIAKPQQFPPNFTKAKAGVVDSHLPELSYIPLSVHSQRIVEGRPPLEPPTPQEDQQILAQFADAQEFANRIRIADEIKQKEIKDFDLKTYGLFRR